MMITINIQNLESELTSFPITQSLILRASEVVEKTQLDSTVILFRLISDDRLINMSEPYGYTLGYFKQTFDTIPMYFTVTANLDGSSNITCKPKEALHVDSKYALFVSKELSNSFVQVSKPVSKSNSNIDVNILNNVPSVLGTYTLTVISTPNLKDGFNLVKFNIVTPTETVEQTLNLKSSYNTITLGNIKISIPDTAFSVDEQFVITLTEQTTLASDVISTFDTIGSCEVTPIPSSEASTLVTNAQILSFYNTSNNVSTTPITINTPPEYLGMNVFTFDLPLGTEKADIDLTSFVSNIRECFNNYILNTLDLYHKYIKYKLYIKWDDFYDKILVELIYSDNPQQTERLVVSMEGW